MTEQKRHDSLAPKGAFASTDAADNELASAQTAALIAAGPDVSAPDMDAPFGLGGVALAASDDPVVTIEEERDSADLCADELIPAGAHDGDRVSVEDAMRTLIEMRLERTRPSDDFGAFELGASAGGPVTTNLNVPTGVAPLSSARAMNSLAPIELAASTSKPAAKPQQQRKSSVLPVLAAAALLLLGVGVYRRANKPTQQATPQAAAQMEAAPTPIAEAIVAPQATEQPQAVAPTAEEPAALDVLDVSESDDAILTLGTPTIINVDVKPATKSIASAGPSARAAKEASIETETVARVAPKKAPVIDARPEAPSRDAIVAGFNSVREEVLACAAGGGGVAPIEATIVSDGRITHATIGGYYQGTPQGSCIARALRKARFTPFTRDSIKVSFPYTL